jgi:hypothetical protein
MGSLFGAKTVAPAGPIAPAAAIEEATFKPGAEDTETEVKKKKAGKKRLQIPVGQTTTATSGSGLNV